MITYVNSVFVSNNTSDALLSGSDVASFDASSAATYKGRFVVYDVDNNTYSITANTKRFKIGMINGNVVKDHKGVSHPVIKWSNIINVHDIKSIAQLSYTADTEDSAYIDFANLDAAVLGTLDDGNKRIIVRITYKDMPHRYRKWTESYEYVTAPGDTKAKIAAGIAEVINKQWKRARVQATVGSLNTTQASNTGVVPGSTTKYFHADSNWGTQSATTDTMVQLVALPYDDDDAVETLNWAEKVRFNVNIYYTDPAAEGWESLNKHFPTGVTIAKVPGKRYAASAKLVRDREAQGMGYDGILNRGNGTWPIIKPAMETKLDGQYNALTIEFENMYRAADDIFRKTKQAVEMYVDSNSSVCDAIVAAIATAQAGSAASALSSRIDGLVTENSLTEPSN